MHTPGTAPTIEGTRRGAAEIANAIRSNIISGEIANKARLPAERELAANYGVARGTVREALNKLAEEGLVEIRRGSGTYVSYDRQTAISGHVIQQARPLELMDARFALEPHICRLAVLHARRNDLDKAEELLRTMEASTHEPARFSEADQAFHRLLAEITDNTLLIWMIDQISSVRNQPQWARMRHVTLDETTIEFYNAQHRRIFEAIKSRDPEQAAALMKDHLETARLSLTRAAST